MRLILYGTESDKEALMHALSAIPGRHGNTISVVGYPDYDSFITGLRESSPNGIVVAMDGADGMEGVIAAKNLCESVPVLWFSNDNGFGVQSYRLGCAYFHQKPVSPQILSAAIAKCV